MSDENASEKFGFPLKPDAVWMPVRTLPQNELKVRDHLQRMGVPFYLPLVRKIRIQNVNRGGRQYTYKKEIWRPMFPSYIFACIAMKDREPLWYTNSVLKIMTQTKNLEDRFLQELHTVRMMEELGRETELEFAPELRPGDNFVIESGVWTGIYGKLLRKDKITSWTVYLETMGTYISTRIDPSKFKFRKLD